MKRNILLSLFLLFASPCLAEMLSVIHQPAEMRDRPLVAGSKIVRELPRYTPLEVLGIQSNYYQVKDVQGNTGYVHQSLTSKQDSIVVISSLCNVRSGPGTEFPVVFKAVKGDLFKTTAKELEWLQIKNPEGKSGWIWQDLTWGAE